MGRLRLLATAATALAACETPKGLETTTGDLLAPTWETTASADVVGGDGARIGRAVFGEAPGGVVIRVDLEGLAPGWHGLHLHETADCSDAGAGFQASGGHVNPDARAHGLLNANGAHRADLPNVYAGADGRATAEIFRADVRLSPTETLDARSAYALIDADGFAVILHENADDHVSQPIGGAGRRVGCAALGAE
ncbi:MAG: superoxide dismutase family protein [Parvularculaceae bacterium]